MNEDRFAISYDTAMGLFLDYMILYGTSLIMVLVLMMTLIVWAAPLLPYTKRIVLYGARYLIHYLRQLPETDSPAKYEGEVPRIWKCHPFYRACHHLVYVTIAALAAFHVFGFWLNYALCEATCIAPSDTDPRTHQCTESDATVSIPVNPIFNETFF